MLLRDGHGSIDALFSFADNTNPSLPSGLFHPTNWASPFLILVMPGELFHFGVIFNRNLCKQTV